LKFTSSGKKKFAKVTQKNVGRRLAILIDEKVISAPQIREPILNGEAEITGDFSLDEARMLSAVLNSGALPVPLIVEEERSVGPLLGSDAIRRGINSIILGAILVIVFMLVYYLWGGIISVFCLFLDLLFILAGLRLFGATLTLPGIAGMILTLGMAVDANVLIFERIREELSLNRPFSLAIKNGFDKAKRTIFDANITTLIAAFFLFVYGTGPIRGFATTLSLGILASIFTAVYVGRTIFSFFILKFKKFPMLKILPNFSMDFVKWKNLCLLLSFIIIVAGITNFYLKKEKVYGIDFKGGQILEYKVTPPVKIEKMRDILRENNLRDLAIQEFKDIKGAISIKSKKDVAQDVERVLNKNFKEVKILKRTTIGPAIGKILKKKAFFSILFSLLGILIYIGFRFKHFDFAFAAVIALFHDVLISLGLLSFSGYELSLLVITALLTIAGYSINDTIVVYDRIREIGPRFPKLSLREVINQAINNTLSRTIITSLTTILVVISIFLYGGESLKGFSFTLLVGFIAGTYSSIYIASPLVLFFRKSSR
jgi:SecD/SecF fusion protein